MLVISLIIGAVLWVLYHKIFHVVYFGGTFRQILNELTVCIVLGFVIAVFGANILGVALVFIIQVIGYLLLGAAIIFGIWLIYKIVKAIVIHFKKKNGTYIEKSTDEAENAPDEVVIEENIQEDVIE